MTFLIGLTGGIGSGKTSAANLFAERGAEIIDTDELAHVLTRPGGLGMAAIRQVFGAEFVTLDGALDRAKMRALVFSDPGAKGRLEGILHPLIREEVERRIAESRAPYALVVVPLLVETGAYGGRIDRLLVVDCAEETQIARTMARSRLTRDEVLAIMGTQVPRAVRLAAADDVIVNDGDLGELRRQVQMLHEKYLALAPRTSAAG